MEIFLAVSRGEENWVLISAGGRITLLKDWKLRFYHWDVSMMITMKMKSVKKDKRTMGDRRSRAF